MCEAGRITEFCGRKDKTLVEILDRLRSLEGKVDQTPTGHAAFPCGFGPPQPSPSSQPDFSTDLGERMHLSRPNRPSQKLSPSEIGRDHPYRHASAAHKMLTWSAIQQVLLQSLSPNIGDLKSFEQGSAFMIRGHEGAPNLPLDDALQDRPFVGMQSQATRTSGGSRVTFPGLTRDVMHRLASSYFDTFNSLYPFMDRQNFISDTLTRVHSEGFDGGTDSILALLVFALGELAIECFRRTPIEIHKGRPSGVRGEQYRGPPA